MSEPPKDRSEYWVRFVCAFLFFGLIAGLVLLRVVSPVGPGGIGVWLLVTISISLYAARVGDEAWEELIKTIRWW